MARALMLSLLVRQHLVLKEKFRAKYPHSWLVWEAGAWNVPESQEGNVAATMLPLTDLTDCLPQGDAMCFELVASTRPEPLKLGRASQNALVVNDATVSREQLAFTPLPGGRWGVECLPNARPVQLGGTPLQPGRVVPLEPGQQLTVGDVRFTFHDTADFSDRIAEIAQRVLAQTGAPAR